MDLQQLFAYRLNIYENMLTLKFYHMEIEQQTYSLHIQNML